MLRRRHVDLQWLPGGFHTAAARKGTDSALATQFVHMTGTEAAERAVARWGEVGVHLALRPLAVATVVGVAAVVDHILPGMKKMDWVEVVGKPLLRCSYPGLPRSATAW